MGKIIIIVLLTLIAFVIQVSKNDPEIQKKWEEVKLSRKKYLKVYQQNKILTEYNVLTKKAGKIENRKDELMQQYRKLGEKYEK